MITELLQMNGYGLYVWSSFLFTFVSFTTLYVITKIQYTKEEYGNDIKNQEIIAYTSGLGGLFKPGLPVGKISIINPHEIVFFYYFKQLEYVKIISLNIEDNN